jgi:methyl-accepting chemotaxis protein
MPVFSFPKETDVTDDTFISREFKFRFILKFCGIAVLGCLLFSGLILYFCRGTLTTTFNGARLVLRETSLAVFPGILYTNLIILSLAIILVIGLTFYLFYRIRKPFFRFRNDLSAIADGDLTTIIRYRPKDQTKILAENINQMTRAFNSKIRDIESEFKIIIDAASNDQVPNDVAVELIRLHRSIKNRFVL